MTLAGLASNILIVNAFWDLLTGLALLLFMVTGRFKWLADSHLLLLRHPEDRTVMVSILMAVLLMQWAWSRFFAGAFYRLNRFDGAFTYLLEAALMIAGIVFERIDRMRGWSVVALCCAGAVFFSVVDE